VAVPASTDPVASVGLGTAAEVEGLRVLVGGRRFMEARGVLLDAASAQEAAAHAAGAAPIFVAVEDTLGGVLVLEDALRSDARRAVDALRARRMRDIIMLSGDHPEPTREIAERLLIARHYAEFLPEDKARLIRALRDEGRVVAMVGDGVNDALALREADVGIAVQGGAEVVTEAAGVVLLRGGLDGVVRSLDLGRDAVDSFRQAIGLAVRGNLAAVGFASFGLLGPTGAILLSNGAAVIAALYAVARQSPGTRVEPSATPRPVTDS
jgi:P-type E1-E2 ATPase